MKFSNLSEVELKQRLNLSMHAYMTLVQDMDIFCPDIAVSQNGNIPSSVINLIFEKYHEYADASIAHKLKIQKTQLVDLLGSSSEINYMIGKILKSERIKLESQAQERCKTKGCPISFRINDQNYRYLAEDGQAEAEHYQDDVGLYIKTVIEEYASLPYNRREQIYNITIWDKMKKAIDDQCQIKLTIKKTKEASHKSYIYVKPYLLCQDSEKLYNYLVGYIRNSDNSPWTIGAIRFSSVADCSVLKVSAAITAAAKKKIEKHLQTHGVEYIASGEDAQKIVVQFTPAGEKMYRRLLHLRPLYKKKYDNLIYEFQCTQWQALNYFFKFGRDVIILEPEKLAKSFRKRYQAAADQYK